MVIPLTTQHYAMLAKNLLYTGVTRGKRLVLLVGQRRALGIASKKQKYAQAMVEAERMVGTAVEITYGSSMPCPVLAESGIAILR